MPPKRKAEAIDETEKTTHENSIPVFSHNTHYTTLYLNFSHRIPYSPEVFTYEGVRLCHICLQIWHPRHDNSSSITRCRTAVPKFSKPCDSCKMPLKLTHHEKRDHSLVTTKDGASACDIATRLGTTEDTWKPDSVFRTLVCPGCKIPGFNEDSMREHLRDNECVGRKEFMLRTKKTLTPGRFPVQCPRCKHWFRPRTLGTHVCGSDLDPVWLGKQEVFPDTSKPYLVWGHELPPPHGPTSFGGGYRREDGKGAIPARVLERSWAAPYATSTRVSHGSRQQEDLYGLVKAVKHLLKNQDVVEALANSPIAQKYTAAWVTNMSKKGISDKVQTMRIEFERLNRIANECLLQRYGVTYGQVKGARKCLGFAWRHGSFDCRHGSSISLGTVSMTSTLRRNIRLLGSCCAYCTWDSDAIHNWTRYSKFNGEGERLCTRPNCLEVLKTSIDCARHAVERREKTLALQAARLLRRQNKLEESRPYNFRARRGHNLWRIVSRQDIATFFSNLTDARFSALDDDWRRVQSSITSSDYHGPSVFYIDTESSFVSDQESQKTLIPFEVAILDHLGNVVVNTTIDYGSSVADLMRGCPQRFIAKSCTIYGLRDSSGKTRGMTPAQLRHKLRASGLNRDSILVEHSSSNWDQKALAAICEEDTPQKTLPTLQLLSSLQYRGPRDLQTMFLITWPNSKLNSLHHRALWDVSKLLMILRCLFGRGLMEEPVTAGFFKECLSFEDVGHSGSNNAGSGINDELDGGDESETDEEYGELDWDDPEMDIAE